MAISKTLAVVVLMTAPALSACEAGESRSESLGLAQAPADLSALKGTWVTDHVTDPATSLVPDSRIEIRFKSDRISVNAGCNTMFGGASIDGEHLHVPVLAQTHKACDDELTRQDAWLAEFLGSRPEIEVLDRELWLSQGEDTVIHLTQE